MVIHSATKYLGGHSDLTAGVVAGSSRWIDPARQMMIQTGACLDPGCAYLLLRGLKTLHLRVQRGCENAAKIARGVAAGIRRSSGSTIPGWRRPADRELAARQMSDFGTMVSFDIRGGQKAAGRFIDRLQGLVPGGQPWRGGVHGVVPFALLARWPESKTAEAARRVGSHGPAFGGHRRCRRPDCRPGAGAGEGESPRANQAATDFGNNNYFAKIDVNRRSNCLEKRLGLGSCGRSGRSATARNGCKCTSLTAFESI